MYSIDVALTNCARAKPKANFGDFSDVSEHHKWKPSFTEEVWKTVKRCRNIFDM